MSKWKRNLKEDILVIYGEGGGFAKHQVILTLQLGTNHYCKVLFYFPLSYILKKKYKC